MNRDEKCPLAFKKTFCSLFLTDLLLAKNMDGDYIFFQHESANRLNNLRSGCGNQKIRSL